VIVLGNLLFIDGDGSGKAPITMAIVTGDGFDSVEDSHYPAMEIVVAEHAVALHDFEHLHPAFLQRSGRKEIESVAEGVIADFPGTFLQDAFFAFFLDGGKGFDAQRGTQKGGANDITDVDIRFLPLIDEIIEKAIQLKYFLAVTFEAVNL